MGTIAKLRISATAPSGQRVKTCCFGRPPSWKRAEIREPSFVPTGAIDWTVCWLVVTHVYFSTLEMGGWSQLTRVFFQGWLNHQPVWCHCPVASGDAPWPQYWLWWAANGISQGEGVGPCWWGRGRWSCRTLGIPSWGILNDCNAGLSPRHHGFSKTCFGLPTLHGMISAAESFLTYRGWFMVVWYVLSLDLAQPQPSTP